MPSTPEKLPLIPKIMPKWFWPLVIVVCLSFTGFVTTLCVTMQVRRTSPLVKQAIALASKDARVAALGLPLRPGFVVVGDSTTAEGVEHAYWQLYMKGSQGEGVLRLNATRPESGTDWTVTYLTTFLPNQDGHMITLMGDPEHPPINFGTNTDRRDSQEVKMAVRLAQKNTQITAVLGDILETGYWIDGDETVVEGVHSCHFECDIKGNKGKGHLSFHASLPKDASEWILKRVEVTLPGQSKALVVLDENTPPAPKAKTKTRGMK